MAKNEIDEIAKEWLNSGMGKYVDDSGRIRWELIPNQRPKCATCGELATDVEVNPAWQRAGAPYPDRAELPAGEFYCSVHEGSTGGYPISLEPKSAGESGISIQRFRDLLHVGSKLWGPAFLAWLLTDRDLWHLRR